MVKKIKFIIDEQGEVSLEVAGVVGNSCEEISKDFEELLGKIHQRTLKDSFYQDESLQEIQEVENE